MGLAGVRMAWCTRAANYAVWTAEAALDACGSYVFVALTPTHRFRAR